MTCAFFSHLEGLPNAGALDLSFKPKRCTANCRCLACILKRLDIPVQARKRLLQQWKTHYVQKAPLTAFNFDHNTNHFNPNGEEKSLMETRNFFERHNFSNQVCETFGYVPASQQLSPEHFAYHNNEYAMESPQSTRSFRSPAFPGTHLGSPVHEPFNRSAFNPCLSMGMMFLNAFTLHPALTSPTTATTKPATATSGGELGKVMRPGSSSPAVRSLSLPGSRTTLSNQQATATAKDKDTLYMQKRLKNNLAAKRSRDLRRQREDKIAVDCRRLHKVLNRVKLIQSAYRKFLVDNNLDRSESLQSSNLVIDNKN